MRAVHTHRVDLRMVRVPMAAWWSALTEIVCLESGRGPADTSGAHEDEQPVAVPLWRSLFLHP
jgi:hypothetical protein